MILWDSIKNNPINFNDKVISWWRDWLETCCTFLAMLVDVLFIVRLCTGCQRESHVDGDFNTLRPRQNAHHFAGILKCNFLNDNVWIPINISLKFIPKGPINNITTLVWIMVWHRPADKPLSESIMVSLPTHLCVTRPQWVKMHWRSYDAGVKLNSVCVAA